MKNLNDFNIDDMFNDNISEAVIANAASLIEDYGENIAILHGINKELEDKRILIPIAVRKDNYSPYKYGLIDKAYKIIVKPEFDVIADNVLYNKQLIQVGKTVPVVYERSIGSNNGEIHLRERWRSLILPCLEHGSASQNMVHRRYIFSISFVPLHHEA